MRVVKPFGRFFRAKFFASITHLMFFFQGGGGQKINFSGKSCFDEFSSNPGSDLIRWFAS